MTKELIIKTEALLKDYLRKLERDDFDMAAIHKMQEVYHVIGALMKLQEEM
jgi:hypothetical protein